MATPRKGPCEDALVSRSCRHWFCLFVRRLSAWPVRRSLYQRRGPGPVQAPRTSLASLSQALSSRPAPREAFSSSGLKALRMAPLRPSKRTPTSYWSGSRSPLQARKNRGRKMDDAKQIASLDEIDCPCRTRGDYHGNDVSCGDTVGQESFLARFFRFFGRSFRVLCSVVLWS
jgi:hypothetical protein